MLRSFSVVIFCLTGSKYISKSEHNLLTPQCDPVTHRTSWCAETPVGAQAFGGGSFTDTPMNMCLKGSYVSEPAIVASKPPAVASLPMKLCCASSADSLESESSITKAQSQTGPTLLKMKSFTESNGDLQAVLEDPCNSPEPNTAKPPDSIVVPPPGTPTDRVLSADTDTSRFPAPQSRLANDQNITFGQIAALTPLHIDSVVFESDVFCSPPTKADKGSVCAAPISSHNSSVVGESDREVEEVNYSRLVDALDIHSPELFKLGVSSGLQSTPYKLDVGLDEDLDMPLKIGTVVSAALGKSETCPESGSNDQPPSPRTEKRRVAEHIQHFNKLTLHSPRGSRAAQIRSPLKFQRTPVRQTVRRMNSLLGDGRRPAQSSRVGKAVSLESGLSPRPQPQPHQDVAQVKLSNSITKPPPVPPKKPSSLAWKPKTCALGDMTNKVQPKSRVDGSVPDPAGAQKAVAQQLLEKDRSHYRGSPRNPLNQARLLSATKPVDF